jgi:protein O-mannosyl-transferase
MASQDTRTLSSTHRGMLLGSLLLLSFALFANTLFNGFVFDDHSQIETNPYVHSFRYVGKLFGTSLLAQQGKQAPPNFYRPLSNLFYLICFQLFGDSAAGYHLICVLVHCLAVWLVFLAGSRLFRNEWLGLLAASMFALHPVHVEPVAWIDGIGDPLATVFLLAAFCLYLRLDEIDKGSRGRILAGMNLAFAAALFTKETAVIFPVLAVLFEHLYRRDRTETTWLQKFSRYSGLWLTFGFYMALRVAAVGQLAPAALHSEVTRREAFLSALALIGQYARKLLWPVPLVAFVPFQKSTSLFETSVLLGLITLLAVVALFILLWRRAHLYSFTLLWMAFSIAPGLNTRWMTASVFAERYLYLASVAFSWLLAGTALWAWDRMGRRSPVLRWALAGTTGILACLAVYATVARTFDWRSDRALIVSTLRVLPDSAHAHVQYGIFRWAEGAHGEAIHEWQLALSLNPESVEAMAELGKASFENKQYDQASAWLQKALALKPHFTTAHVLLGQVWEAEGKTADAESEYRRAVEIYPANAEAREALGSLYLKEGRLHEAEEHFQVVVGIAPDLPSWRALGKIYSAENRTGEAEDAWQHVLTFERFDPEAHLALGHIYLEKGLYPQAQREFDACLLMDPKNKEALGGVAKLSELAGNHAATAR